MSGKRKGAGAGGRLDAALEHARRAAEARPVTLPPAPVRRPAPLPVSLLLSPPVAAAVDAEAEAGAVPGARVVRECIAEALDALAAGEVVEAEPNAAPPAAGNDPGEVVRRSVRLPADLMARVRKLAEDRGERPGATARHLLAAGLELRRR